jgi:hypothetical protein
VSISSDLGTVRTRVYPVAECVSVSSDLGSETLGSFRSGQIKRRSKRGPDFD